MQSQKSFIKRNVYIFMYRVLSIFLSCNVIIFAADNVDQTVIQTAVTTYDPAPTAQKMDHSKKHTPSCPELTKIRCRQCGGYCWWCI